MSATSIMPEFPSGVKHFSSFAGCLQALSMEPPPIVDLWQRKSCISDGIPGKLMRRWYPT
jgi:hypothetical protein